MPTRFDIRPGALCLLVAFGAAASLTPALPAQTANAPLAVNNEVVEVTTPRTTAVIVEQFTKILKSPTRITHVDGFDQSVVDVTALSPTELQVKGMVPGATTIVITDERNQRREVLARVVSHLQAHLSRLFPDANIEVVHINPGGNTGRGGSIVLRGWVTQPEHVTEVVDIAGQFYPPAQVLNQLRVGGVQQVQLNVKVMEVQRTLIRSLGINFAYADDTALIASTPSAGLASTLRGAIVNDDSSFDAVLEALREERLIKILAQPKLVTTNGRPANMLAGGEFPILVPQALGQVTIEWREFGVQMEAVPYVLGNGRLRLELQPEFSERDLQNAVTLNGITVPALTSRRVNTQVEMKFGQTLVLAGLLSTRQVGTTEKIPFLGELPGIGAAFRRVRYEDAETELLILVTPELVAPMDPSQVPPLGPGQFTDAPTDRELFHYGMLEVPKYGPHCPDCELGGRVIPLPPHTDLSGEMIVPDAMAPPAPPSFVPPLPGGPGSPHMMPPMAPGATEELQPPPSVLELEEAVSGAASGSRASGQWARTAGARSPETANTPQQTSYTGSTSTSNQTAAPRPMPRAEAGRARLTPAGAVQPGAGGLLQPVQR